MSQMQQRAEFELWLDDNAPWLKNFSADEVLTKCERHLNHIPDRKLWPRILRTLRVVQDLRTVIRKPLQVNSCYRSKTYNATLPGSATRSQHIEFTAMDICSPFQPGHAQYISPRAIYELLLAARAANKFKGGIGLYRTFVHIDTRGVNVKPWKGGGVG